jgi:hypothetical protein
VVNCKYINSTIERWDSSEIKDGFGRIAYHLRGHATTEIWPKALAVIALYVLEDKIGLALSNISGSTYAHWGKNDFIYEVY